MTEFIKPIWLLPDEAEIARTVTGTSFTVLGTPVAQGSKRAIVRGGKAVLLEMGVGHHSWRAAVALAAFQARQTLDVTLDGPLHVTARFRFQMPASRPKATREAGECWKISAPDLDKLARALGDGLTEGGLIVDDRCIVEWVLSKIETTGWTGAEIHIKQIEGQP